MMRQDPKVTVQFDQIAHAYSDVVQAAGLPVGIIDACKADALSPDDLRRSLTRQLQATLPKSVPLSVRAEPSPQATGQWLAQTEAKVRDAVIAAAHASPELRAVVSKDQAGREQTEFFGRKSAWMDRYKFPPMLTKAIGGAPPVIPVVL
ncbi:hypothetical protein DR64_3441 [Paraburkholderia xenovorans LB400]|uniref:Uncharacterized protein n=1 Tax=Paraburkholderia xenovorans (strain LB400) TaxID=266265 RepID=Q13W67_PARXL|nr:hypothetical protein [Paraburkholderia xenovorans]ABE31672.1 hypothetical protein Bxe_A1281 [Paraburkholderia xenovorans LB400]AIP32418.1 hypothetical protein DR64_3441 [Paraburkholderia xenovorans LB400]